MLFSTSTSTAPFAGSAPRGSMSSALSLTPSLDLIVSDNPNIFTEVVESMAQDDRRSQFIRFAVKLGPLSKLLPPDMLAVGDESAPPAIMDLEAQGIMVYSGPSGGESHVSFVLPSAMTIPRTDARFLRPCG
jgi:serine/threonine-protein kinase RIM15